MRTKIALQRLYAAIFDESGKLKYIVPVRRYTPVVQDHYVWLTLYHAKTPSRDFIITVQSETPNPAVLCRDGAFGMQCESIQILTAITTSHKTAAAVDFKLPTEVAEIAELTKADKAVSAKIIETIAAIASRVSGELPTLIALAMERKLAAGRVGSNILLWLLIAVAAIVGLSILAGGGK